MKLSNLFWGLLGVMAFSACSSDEIVPENGGQAFDGQSRFLSVQIANPAAIRTRATVNPGQQDPTGEFEEGLANENAVKSIRFYFFKADGSACPVRRDGKSYYDYSLDGSDDLGSSEGNMSNIEETVKAVLVIETDQDDNVDGLKSMVAVLNGGVGDEFIWGDDNKTLTALRATIAESGSTSYTTSTDSKDNFFLMTSSVFGSKEFCCEVAVSADKLKTAPDLATADPVEIYVERVYAKARLYTEWSDGISPKTVTYNNKTCTAVPLKKAKDSGEYLTTGDNDDVVYAIFNGWDVTGTIDQAYLFKKVDSNWELGWTWNRPSLYRSYWAQNPAKTKLSYLSYNKISKKIGTQGVVNNNSTSYDGENVYCLENAANQNDGTRASYDPADPENGLSNRTQAIVAAVLVTIDGDNIATPLSLAEFGGTQYTEKNALKAMLGFVNHEIYTKEGEGEEAKLVSIKEDMVKFVSGVEAGVADMTFEDSKRYLSYLQLNEEKAKDVTFYKADGSAYADHTEVNKMLANDKSVGARVWSSGQTYYYTDIKHEENADETKGKFGVVRNHIYDIAINSVAGLGTPVLNPNEEIIPQKPKDDETYLAAQINILSWRVVKQNIDLGW